MAGSSDVTDVILLGRIVHPHVIFPTVLRMGITIKISATQRRRSRGQTNAAVYCAYHMLSLGLISTVCMMRTNLDSYDTSNGKRS